MAAVQQMHLALGTLGQLKSADALPTCMQGRRCGTMHGPLAHPCCNTLPPCRSTTCRSPWCRPTAPCRAPTTRTLCSGAPACFLFFCATCSAGCRWLVPACSCHGHYRWRCHFLPGKPKVAPACADDLGMYSCIPSIQLTHALPCSTCGQERERQVEGGGAGDPPHAQDRPARAGEREERRKHRPCRSLVLPRALPRSFQLEL